MLPDGDLHFSGVGVGHLYTNVLNMNSAKARKQRTDIVSKRYLGLICLSLIAASCTTVPPVDFTVQDVGMVEGRKSAELMSLTVGFAPQAQQRRVEANATIPPVWREALQDAINRSLIFMDDQEQKVNLSVRITEFDVPFAGISMTTRVSAIYEIIDRSNGDLLFAQEISSEGVVPASYAFTGAVRAVESWNRAVRNNIADFINVLSQTDISSPVFSGSQ